MTTDSDSDAPVEPHNAPRSHHGSPTNIASSLVGRIGCVVFVLIFLRFIEFLNWMFSTRAGAAVLAAVTALGIWLVIRANRAETKARQEQEELRRERRRMNSARTHTTADKAASAIAGLLNKALPGIRSTAVAGGRRGTTLFVRVDGIYTELPPAVLEDAKRKFKSVGFHRVVIDDSKGRARTFSTEPLN
jgi:hypothetical protein